MTSLTRRLTWLFALVGLGASGAALYVHYQLLVHPGYSSPCDINATFSCTDAYLSPYGSLLGVPVALLGTLFFVFVLLLLVAAALSGRRPAGEAGAAPLAETVPAYLFATSTIGLAAILYLAYAAFFILKTVCVLCLTTYVAVVGLFWVSGLATSFPMTTLPRRATRDLKALVTRPVALGVAVLFLAAAVFAVVFFPAHRVAAAEQPEQATSQRPEDRRSDFEKFWAAQPRTTLPVSSEGAVVVVVKFTDYQCPRCGETYFEYRPIFAKYEADMPGAVKLVPVDYPLNPTCNPNVPRMVHPYACDAAVAARLAKTKHREAAMEEWLYSNQATFNSASIRQALQTIGHVENPDAGYDTAMQGIKADVSLGKLLGIHQTPTFYINGVLVPEGGLAPAYMDMAIQYELKRAGKIK